MYKEYKADKTIVQTIILAFNFDRLKRKYKQIAKNITSKMKIPFEKTLSKKVNSLSNLTVFDF